MFCTPVITRRYRTAGNGPAANSLTDGKLIKGSAMRIPLRYGLYVLVCILPIAAEAQTRVSSQLVERSWTTMVQNDLLVRQQAVQKSMILPGKVSPKTLGSAYVPVQPGLAEVTPVRPTSPLASPPPLADFDALLDNTHVIPPDTYGSVGPSHIVTMLNSEVRVQGKDGSEISTVSLAAFWSTGVGSSDLSDPHVLYDVQGGRWIASITIDPDTNTARIGIAVSASSDPTGDWRFLTFDSPDTTVFPDYPQLGFNNKWIVVTANIFKTVSHGGTFQGPAFWAIDKAAAMLSSGTVGGTRFNPGYDSPNEGFTEQPMICYDPSDTLWFMESGAYSVSGTALIRISMLTGSTLSPTWTPIAGGPFPGSGFFTVTNNFKALSNGATQKGSSQKIDNGDARASGAVYRNGFVWFSNSGGLPLTGTVTRTAAFWYQINPRLTTPIVQSGVVDPGANSHVIYPSIAVNKLNSVCIGFTHTDTSRYAEAAYVVRQVGDAAGTTQGIALLKAGQGSYFKTFGGGRNRWGDFSNTVVDPSDSLTFWTIQEYAGTPVGNTATDGSGRWATHWGKIGVDVPLPIQLTSLSGKLTSDGSVAITWTTASEVNCYGFTIERSANTTDNFVEVPNGFVAGHGTTTDPHTYSFNDTPPSPGRYYYRLTEIGLNGSTHAFDPVLVDGLTGVAANGLPFETALLQNYPNPFNPKTVVSGQWTVTSVVRLAVYDVLGREVAVLASGSYPAGKYAFTFDGSNLSSGTYFYRLTAGNFTAVRKMSLLK